MINITSKENQKIKDLIKLRDDSKFRSDKSLFYVEGERIIKDTPLNLVDSIFVSKSKLDDLMYILKQFNADNIYIVEDNIFDKIKDTNNSQGIIAIVHKNVSNKISGGFILILDDINDPGNMGTIIRTSEATGVDTLIITNKSCDIYNTKAIRSSMSSIFRTNIVLCDDITNIITELKHNGYKIYVTALTNDSISYRDVSYNGKIAIIVGNEANGVHKELISMSDSIIKIPMKGNIESLNVAIATSIVCYEASINRYEN